MDLISLSPSGSVAISFRKQLFKFESLQNSVTIINGRSGEMAIMIEHGSVGRETRLREKPAGMIKRKSAQNMILDRK